MRASVRRNLRTHAVASRGAADLSQRGPRTLPLFAGAKPSLRSSTIQRGVLLARPYSSGATSQASILGAKNIWLPLGSVLVASTLGAMTWSRRAVHAQEHEEEGEKKEDEKKDEPQLASDKEDFVHYLLERPILLLLLDREDVDDKMDDNLEEILADEDLKAVHLLDYQFFSEDKNKFPTKATALVYHFNKETKQIEAYVYPADKELTAANIKQFLEDIKEHKLGELRYHPSEPRPAEDKHPEVKHLKVVTTDSFKDVVLDSDKDVLVYLHLPSNSTPTDLQILASAFGGDKDIVIAECSSFLNELDPTYFGDTPIEGIKLFRKGNKNEPVTYRGKGDLLDVIAFVSQQRGDNGEETYRHLRRADTARLLREFEKTLGDYYLHSLAYKEFVPTSEKAKEMFNKLFDMYDQLNANEDPFKKNAATLKQQLRDELKTLERAGLHNVQIIDKDKYKEDLEEARKKGKVVVFFWRKGCWPCKKLNPMIGKISQDFPDITFLKVDADAEGLNATPTFHVYESDKPEQLSSMKLVTLFHDQARQRGLSGYAHWLPPAERAKLKEPASEDDLEKRHEAEKKDVAHEQNKPQEQQVDDEAAADVTKHEIEPAKKVEERKEKEKEKEETQ